MPCYAHECPRCEKVYDFFRPMSASGKSESCPDCGSPTARLYSSSVPQEFPSYVSKEYGCQITSARQERAVMRKHGHVLFRETATYQKPEFRAAIKRARRKPAYFSAAGHTPFRGDA